MPHTKVAFRCKSCGHLHHASHAGDNSLPHSCCACGAGVHYGPDAKSLESIIAANSKSGADLAAAIKTALQNPQKSYDPHNWEVLADASPDRLEELELCSEHIEQHIPSYVTSNRAPQNVSLVASESTLVADKP